MLVARGNTFWPVPALCNRIDQWRQRRRNPTVQNAETPRSLQLHCDCGDMASQPAATSLGCNGIFASAIGRNVWHFSNRTLNELAVVEDQRIASVYAYTQNLPNDNSMVSPRVNGFDLAFACCHDPSEEWAPRFAKSVTDTGKLVGFFRCESLRQSNLM